MLPLLSALLLSPLPVVVAHPGVHHHVHLGHKNQLRQLVPPSVSDGVIAAYTSLGPEPTDLPATTDASDAPDAGVTAMPATDATDSDVTDLPASTEDVPSPLDSISAGFEFLISSAVIPSAESASAGLDFIVSSDVIPSLETTSSVLSGLFLPPLKTASSVLDDLLPPPLETASSILDDLLSPPLETASSILDGLLSPPLETASSILDDLLSPPTSSASEAPTLDPGEVYIQTASSGPPVGIPLSALPTETSETPSAPTDASHPDGGLFGAGYRMVQAAPSGSQTGSYGYPMMAEHPAVPLLPVAPGTTKLPSSVPELFTASINPGGPIIPLAPGPVIISSGSPYPSLESSNSTLSTTTQTVAAFAILCSATPSGLNFSSTAVGLTSSAPVSIPTSSPVLAHAMVTGGPLDANLTTITKNGTDGCATLYTPVTTPICHTIVSGMGQVPVKVTDCAQLITFSSSTYDPKSPYPTVSSNISYSISSASLSAAPVTTTSDSGPIFSAMVANLAAEASGTPGASGFPMGKRMAYFLANWKDLADGRVPSNVTVKDCISGMGGELCRTTSEIWLLTTEVAIQSVTKAVHFVGAVGGPVNLALGGGVWTTDVPAASTPFISVNGVYTTALPVMKTGIERLAGDEPLTTITRYSTTTQTFTIKAEGTSKATTSIEIGPAVVTDVMRAERH